MIKTLFLFSVFLVAGVFVSSCGGPKPSENMPIKVGVLFSKTGAFSLEGQALIDATLLAIDELNARGGLLERPIVPIVIDGESDPAIFLKAVKKLIEQDKVSVIFGCENSVERRTVEPLISKDSLVFIYPGRNEGVDSSKNIIFTGEAPNQQIIPAVSWAFQNLGKRFFLVGSDSIYSHIANAIIKDYIYALDGEVVGESYLPWGSKTGMNSIVETINLARPNVIINTIIGQEAVAFFQSLRTAGIYPDDVPTVSLSLNENTLRRLNSVDMEGDFIVGSYFQSLKLPSNKQFIESFRQKYGKGRAIDNSMISAYSSVILWAKAVKEGKSVSPQKVFDFIENQSVASPTGLIYVDPETLSVYKPSRIGKINTENQLDVVWDSNISVAPTIYTIFKTPQEWDEKVKDLYLKWGRQWYHSE